MTILSIDHVQLAMPRGEEDKARAFYVEVLGLVETPKPAQLAGRGGMWFRGGSAQIHLGVEADFRPARKAHPALLVEDFERLIGRVRAAGDEAEVAQPGLGGYKRARVFDPFGNRIELMEAETRGAGNSE